MFVWKRIKCLTKNSTRINRHVDSQRQTYFRLTLHIGKHSNRKIVAHVSKYITLMSAPWEFVTAIITGRATSLFSLKPRHNPGGEVMPHGTYSKMHFS